MFELKYFVTEDDYFEFNKYHLLNTKYGKKTLLIYRLLLPFIFVIIAFVAATSAGEFSTAIIAELCWFAFASILWMIFSTKIYLRSLKRSIKKRVKKEKYLFEPEGKLIFGEIELTEITDHNEMKVKYDALEKICITNDFFYIYISPIRCFLLPHASLENEEQKEKFIAFLKDKLGNEKIIN